MPLLRRRPLLRAAMVGGTAYAAGKHVQSNRQHEYDQDQQLADMQASQAAPPPGYAPQPAYAPPPPPPPAAPAPTTGADRIQALTDLKGLLDSGVLTQAEFDTEKQRILQGG